MKEPAESFPPLLQRVPGWAHCELVTQPAVADLYLGLLKPDLEYTYLPDQVAEMWANMPYWAFAWAAGRAMAAWILENPQWIQGKTVLDLGCGSGVAAIAAAMAGAREVLVADLDPLALRAAEHNAALNQVCLQPVTLFERDDIDLLLASDLLYDPASHRLLQELTARIPEALFAEPESALSLSHTGHWLASLRVVGGGQSSTLPAIEDFDDELVVRILHYQRCQERAS